MPDRRMHESRLLRGPLPDTSRLEPSGLHDVHDDLCGLDESTIRLLRQVVGLPEHLHAVGGCVGSGKAVAAEDEDDLRPMFGEDRLSGFERR